MKTRNTYARLLVGLVSGAASAATIAQQDYPNKPIRYISPYPAGGSTSYIARLIGQQLTDAWGQQVVVDNRGGANTMIGTEIALRSRPDGYTLVSVGGTMAGNHWLMKPPYNALKDLIPIASVVSYENVMVVPPSLKMTKVSEVVVLAKTKPGFLTYGSSSIGGPSHLVAELFNSTAGVKTRHIPYKGGGPAVVDLMGGHIHLFFSNPVNITSHVRAGRLVALAVTGKTRNRAFPDTPTFAEEGLSGVTLTNWMGVGGPTGIPKAIVDRLSGEIRKLMAMPETRDKVALQGFEPFFNGPEQTAELLRSDIARYGNIIREANIKVE